MTRRFAWAALVVMTGCEEDLLDQPLDAGGGDAAVVTPEGNFTCIDTPYPTTAPDSLSLRGFAHHPNGTRAGGLSVEVRSAADDSLLFQDVTNDLPGDRQGTYGSTVATGGTAPRVYRRIAGSGDRLDTYTFDGIPVNISYEMASAVFSDAITTGFYQTLGIERELTKGTLVFDVKDCGVPPAATRNVAGATVDAPPGGTVFYGGPDGFIDLSLTATTSSGVVLITSVTPGPVDIVVHAGPIQYRPWSVRVFANSWTTGVVHP